MEQFFGILQRGLGQLDATGEYEEGTLRESDNIADLHLVIPAGSSSG